MLLNFAQGDESYFGVCSLRLSADDKEVIAGANDNRLYVYDVERNDVSRYSGHKDEVNGTLKIFAVDFVVVFYFLALLCCILFLAIHAFLVV